MCHKSDEPIFITKNGYGDMVLMSMELFEATQKKWNMYSDIEHSEQQIKEGRTKDYGFDKKWRTIIFENHIAGCNNLL